jgi:hypothetical protein
LRGENLILPTAAGNPAIDDTCSDIMPYRHWMAARRIASASRRTVRSGSRRSGRRHVLHRTVKYPKGKPVVEDFAQPVTPEEAVQWGSTEGPCSSNSSERFRLSGVLLYLADPISS